jgi:predicted membrane-bound spermidine synthase
LAALVVLLAFFVSGASALAYQICWQRLLFAVIGVDIESVTLIVAAFMLGLGVGAATGGYLADHFQSRLLHCFAAIEAAIGLFGLLSPFAIEAMGGYLAVAPRVLSVAALFLIFLLPTVCMGATLPILVRWLQQRLHNIGASVGQLYFVNTMGAAVGVVGVGFWLLTVLDLRQIVWLAAFANLAVAALVVGMLRSAR